MTLALSTKENEGFNSSAMSISDSLGGALSLATTGIVFAAFTTAVQSFAGGLARMHLERVEVVEVGEDQMVLSVVTMSSALGSERLVGVSAVREDVRQAVIRATLDAINRRLEAVLSAG